MRFDPVGTEKGPHSQQRNRPGLLQRLHTGLGEHDTMPVDSRSTKAPNRLSIHLLGSLHCKFLRCFRCRPGLLFESSLMPEVEIGAGVSARTHGLPRNPYPTWS